MPALLFGTGGTPHSARNRATVDGIRRIAELGLGCMEIEFVQGVKMGEASARQVAQAARENGLAGLFAYTSPDNTGMIKLFNVLPYQVKRTLEDDMVVLKCRFSEPKT